MMTVGEIQELWPVMNNWYWLNLNNVNPCSRVHPCYQKYHPHQHHHEERGDGMANVFSRAPLASMGYQRGTITIECFLTVWPLASMVFNGFLNFVHNGQ